MDWVSIVRQHVIEMSSKRGHSVSHRIDHIDRVAQYVDDIAAAYPESDKEIMAIAVLLHDAGESYDNKSEHVACSMDIARRLLGAIHYPPDRTDKVLKVIAEHSSEHIDAVMPSSLEARIVFDADKIDGVGAIGIARVFSLFGQMGKGPLEAVEWYRKKICTARGNLQTPEGRRVFAAKARYTETFLKTLERERG
jgi:uncharacterized protein